jgi:catechol 2,3-dioxygenase-like lactoylglutathione lyase family enzyme
MITDTTTDLLGIVQVTIPVSHLGRSAEWYRDLLGLEYVREFVGDGQVTGNALADWDAGYVIALRLRSTTAAPADLRGEHPVVLEANGPEAAERIRARAAAHGIRSTSGVHADASWTEYLDPDGIAVRVVHSQTGPRGFMGLEFRTGEEPAFYTVPRLELT